MRAGPGDGRRKPGNAALFRRRSEGDQCRWTGTSSSVQVAQKQQPLAATLLQLLTGPL